MPLSTPVSVPDASERVAALAHGALMDELRTHPKPGLVSPIDSGSHRDMDFASLSRSADAIRPFFAALARAGERRPALNELQCIGIAAETAMMVATNGANAHRGAIFSLGLICAAEGARGYAADTGNARTETVRDLWGAAILGTPTPSASHGGRAMRRFGVGGARAEAASGFPSARFVGLPALEAGHLLAPGDPEAARVHCLFALVASLDDTNLLHRGGAAGLAFARREASRFLAMGGVGITGWRSEALRIHHAFMARHLSPGGSADLLAVTLFLDALSSFEKRDAPAYGVTPSRADAEPEMRPLADVLEQA